MGVIVILKIITRIDKASRPKAIQLGNREWVIIIKCINALGDAISPFIIFKAIIY